MKPPKPKLRAALIREMLLAEAVERGLEELVVEHHAETMRDRIPLAIDWAAYRKLERAGVYKALAATVDDRLVGYNGFFVQPVLHHMGTLVAMNDVLYVDPAERGVAGVQLVRRAEAWLQAMGVRKIVYASKTYVDLSPTSRGATLGDLLDKLGYGVTETVHEKVI
jgi:hypothetical protein